MSLRFANTHRIFFYSAFSVLSVGVVVSNALKNHSNYYSTAIHLSKSSRSVLVRLTNRPLVVLSSVRKVLANFGVLLSLLCGHVVQIIFFGALRPNEIEVCTSTR